MLDYKQSSLEKYQHIPTNSNQYQIEFIQANNVLVLDITDELVYVGITENTQESTLLNIEKFHKQKIQYVTIPQVELTSWIGKQLGDQDIVTNTRTENNFSLSIDKIANDAPTVNLVNSICIDAIRMGASDIHIESGKDNSIVRYRIDGILKIVKTIDNNKFAAISSRIKIMANLNILEKRQPQDGRISVIIAGENIDFRISIVPIITGESIVLRILGKNNAPSSLDLLGFSIEQLEQIKKMINIPHGLILVTGPTGSGKTTTLNAIMRELVSEEIKIISIEDPVEFSVDGVEQIQINEQIGLGFSSILRRVLRQDPNIIMVGEIRDKETAELSIRAALTGHLVLSTLHTNDSVSVIARLINMGIEPYLLSAVLKGAIAQRLVRRIDLSTGKLNGRTVISETWIMDSELEEIINTGANQYNIISYLKSKKMNFLKEDAIEKIKKGITTKEEVQKEIELF